MSVAEFAKTADAELGDIVWRLPSKSYSTIWLVRAIKHIRRLHYFNKHGWKVRSFFLRMLEADEEKSREEKRRYRFWLKHVPWHRFFSDLPLRAGWVRGVDKIPNPIEYTMLEEYRRLFSCCEDGYDPEDRTVI